MIIQPFEFHFLKKDFFLLLCGGRALDFLFSQLFLYLTCFGYEFHGGGFLFLFFTFFLLGGVGLPSSVNTHGRIRLGWDDG